jgi:hypothetical protein
VLVLDEMDTENGAEMVVRRQWERAKALMCEATGNDGVGAWVVAYDDAETWFANELLEQCGVVALPCQKGKKSKMQGRSMIKELILRDQIEWSDRCVKTLWELENYVDESSRDHHVDLHRYLFTVSGYRIAEVPEPELDKRSILASRSGVLYRDEVVGNKVKDWTRGVL